MKFVICVCFLSIFVGACAGVRAGMGIGAEKGMG